MAKDRAKLLLEELEDLRTSGGRPPKIYSSIASSRRVRASARRLIDYAGLKPGNPKHVTYLLSVISDYLFMDKPSGAQSAEAKHIMLLEKMNACYLEDHRRGLVAILKHLLQTDPEVLELVRSAKGRKATTDVQVDREAKDLGLLKTRFYRAREYAKAGRLASAGLPRSRWMPLLRNLDAITEATHNMEITPRLERTSSGYKLRKL